MIDWQNRQTFSRIVAACGMKVDFGAARGARRNWIGVLQLAFQGWDKVKIETERGWTEAIAPVIITASRATDIPAFFADWFMHRLRAGYAEWVNPFNQKPQYISFAKTRVIVFITKNAQPFLGYLSELNAMGYHFYFQFTLNDYVEEGLEPRVPPLDDRIETFRHLSDRIGKERVIWRFDPLILGKNLLLEKLLAKVQRVGDAIHDYTEKLVFSFADIEAYAKVKRNLAAAGFDYLEFTPTLMEKVAQGLRDLNQNWGLELASCAEQIDLSPFGIVHNRCVDGELMARLFPEDNGLMRFLGVEREQAELFPGLTEEIRGNLVQMKDKGQRGGCGCVPSKDVGAYSTCMHLCKYCYANLSEAAVRSNLRGFRVDGERIITK
jgi:hypothetical protein